MKDLELQQYLFDVQGYLVIQDALGDVFRLDRLCGRYMRKGRGDS
ncbi:MAG: hypothetical protein OXN94_14700 [Chloroflexota bacterium]|nr:hypothetical protein [Chloroflexota bacterium]